MVFLRVISQDTAALGKLSRDSETQKANIVQNILEGNISGMVYLLS